MYQQVPVHFVPSSFDSILNWSLNSYLSRLWTYQQVPVHFVPSSFDSILNQSWSLSLLICTYLMRAASSSFSLSTQASPSRGPAFTVSKGIFCTSALVLSSYAIAHAEPAGTPGPRHDPLLLLLHLEP